MLEMENVCAGYGKKQVLDRVNAQFEKGKITALIGPNGCGKSTLFKAALGMLPLTGGQITADGMPITHASPGSIARKIAYLSQGKAVPDMTVEQLVLHGRFAHLSYPRRYRTVDKEIALSAMKRMHMERWATTPVSSLSGGMRQNVYIAMALAQDTDYILLDEPTTYLDMANCFQLMDILSELAAGGKGVIAILHDLTLAMTYSDRIIAMAEGQTVLSGTPLDLFDTHDIDRIFGIHLQRVSRPEGFYYYYSRNNEKN